MTHTGYERETEQALKALLGDGFQTKKITISTQRAWIESPSRDNVELRPLGRIAIVIEGEPDTLAPYVQIINSIRQTHT